MQWTHRRRDEPLEAVVTMHHTKDKGDLGVAKAHADLAGQGFTVLFPVTEHAPFDLVAYRDGSFVRVQVKYRSARRGAVLVHLRSVWADQHGTQTRPMSKSEVDVVCIYCPDTDSCYYVRPAEYRQSVTLRLTPPRNGQRTGVVLAESVRRLQWADDRERNGAGQGRSRVGSLIDISGAD